jgi:hypothetical protein
MLVEGGHDVRMRARGAVGVVVRSVLLVVSSWLLVGFASPTADPFVIALVWLAGATVVTALGPSRRRVAQWIGTGGFRRVPQ